MSKRHDVSVTGTRISYLVAGAVDAPAMVLLHALGDQGHAWEPVLSRFAAEYRVFAPDLSGHGQSQWPGSYSFENYTDNLVGFHDVLGLDRAVMVGHSMGGVIAYLVAIRQPDRVDRLVIEDIAPNRRRDRPIPDRPEEALDFDWDVAPTIIGQVNGGEPDFWSELVDISAPTLLIGGGTKSHIPQAQLDEVRSLITACELMTLPAGHYVHRSLPELYGQTALEWLSTVSDP